MVVNWHTRIFRRQKKDFFPGQEKGETVVFFARRHPLSFLGLFMFVITMVLAPFLVYIIALMTGLVSLTDTGQKIILILGSSYLLFVLGFFLVGWIDYYLDVMIVTNTRIVDVNQNQLFNRSIAEANLTEIQDVNAEVKGVLATFFHFGTIYVQTAGTAANFEFKYIPNPYRVAKMMTEMHEKALIREEKREANEIGTTIMEKKESENVDEEKINRAAKELSHYRHIRKYANMSSKAGEQKDTKKDAESQPYRKSMGWKEMDNHQPKPQTPPAPKPEPLKSTPDPEKEKDDISYDDLKKGGEVDF